MEQSDTLDHKAAAAAGKYMAGVAWPTVVLGVALTAAYVSVVLSALTGSLSLWLAVPLVAVISYLSYTVLHDAVHGSIAGSCSSLRWLNDALGYLAAWITMIPLTAHRHEHLAHHRHTNDSADDPDFHMGDMCRSPASPLHTAMRGWLSQFDYYRRHRWHRASARQNLWLLLEIAAALLPRLGVLVAGFWLEALTLFGLAWLMGAIAVVYLFAYLVHRPHEQVGRYVDTATIILPWPLHPVLTWCWMYQNYHAIHHLFPRVPFYRYRALYQDIEHVMVARGAPIHRFRWRWLLRRSSTPA
jgi:beta-carotene hydroxylase